MRESLEALRVRVGAGQEPLDRVVQPVFGEPFPLRDGGGGLPDYLRRDEHRV
jgi:hypothetical protein